MAALFPSLINNSSYLLFQSGLQKVDDQLDRVIEQVCKDSDMPLPVSTSIDLSISRYVICHLRVTLCLCFKMSPPVKPFI